MPQPQLILSAPSLQTRLAFFFLPAPIFFGLVAGVFLASAVLVHAQGVSPITITPGIADTDAEMAAYNAAHTPLVSISFVGLPAPIGTTPIATSIQPVVFSPHVEAQNSVCMPVTLPLTAAVGTSAPSRAAATVLLTYPAGNAGEVVWVQMLARSGTLSATDSTGKNYDGIHGFWLTLDVAGTSKFSYQAPNVGGTYQLMTRFGNVKTILSFRVPDATH